MSQRSTLIKSVPASCTDATPVAGSSGAHDAMHDGRVTFDPSAFTDPREGYVFGTASDDWATYGSGYYLEVWAQAQAEQRHPKLAAAVAATWSCSACKLVNGLGVPTCAACSKPQFSGSESCGASILASDRGSGGGAANVATVKAVTIAAAAAAAAAGESEPLPKSLLGGQMKKMASIPTLRGLSVKTVEGFRPKKVEYSGDCLVGGVFMASNVESSCRVWNGQIRHEGIGPLGNIETHRGILGPGACIGANELLWLTDLTPHESLPLQPGTSRSYFRLCTSSLSVWYEAHSTPNPLGIVPGPEVRIVKGDKFEGTVNPLGVKESVGGGGGGGSEGDLPWSFGSGTGKSIAPSLSVDVESWKYWTCRQCTLSNPVTSSKCGACDKSRHAHAPQLPESPS